jgi:hypothetical protein
MILAAGGITLTGQASNAGQAASGQPAATKPGTSKAGTQTVSKRTRGKRKGAKAAAETPPVVETRPPDPPPPDWPANAKAQAASVGWNGRDLSIAATNSSLKQILQDVSMATGVRMEGIGTAPHGDQRVYGSYGPASARVVLGQLLEGSGYNVMMVGDQGEGTPRELVLTAKTGRAASPQGQLNGGQQNQGGDDDAPEEPEQPELPPVDPNLNRSPGTVPQPPGQQGKTPQQILQEIQQRQMQQQQQQGQPPQGSQPPNE